MTFKDAIEQIRSRADLLDVAIELKVVQQSQIRGRSYRGPCGFGHSSVSGKCLVCTNGLFFCHNCRRGGDIFDLVQFAMLGHKSKEGFLRALEWLASRYGIPLEVWQGKTSEEIKEDYRRNEIAAQVQEEASLYFQSQLGIEQRSLLLARGLSHATIDQNRIGYSSPGLLTHLLAKGFSEDDCLLSGLFLKFKNATVELFNNRIMIPYLKWGNVAYFVGRQTPWTPAKEYEKAKYKKQLICSDERAYIAAGIQNNTLFNQDVALKAEEIVVTEGVLDCLSLSQAGFASVSPVTVRFSKSDRELVAKLLRKEQMVYVANDNEWNRTGEVGAREMALHLSKCGYRVKVINLPLLEKHDEARRKLVELEKQARA